MTLAGSSGAGAKARVNAGVNGGGNACAACAGAITLIRAAQLVASPWKNGGGVTREVAAHPADAGLDTFVWRVSVADVAQAGPFSRFAGIDRTLVLLAGAGMLLDEVQSDNAVTTHALTQPLDIVRFAGEARIDARLVEGATRDFNLMVRRGFAEGELEVWHGAQQQGQQKTRHEAQQQAQQPGRTLSADVALLYCASGAPTVALGDAAAHAEACHEAHVEACHEAHAQAPAASPAPADTQVHALQAGDTLRIDAPNALSCTIEGAGTLLAISIRYTQR
ncbi:HutD/Ves family protein [Burkholderia sp. WSM2232]|uniref:HutD/Ves family protein n=1 Tax=Burkholderia sp. WSM2232 TaxID=944436 RepID=UPI00040AB40B|nr:HutD family protein [Burkholderia sp. WSM2232]